MYSVQEPESIIWNKMPKKLSIIIPVYGEEQELRRAIKALNRLEFPWPWELIISQGHSEKRKIPPPPSRIPLTLVHSPKGRGIQMNQGARKARGDVLLFLHVDTLLDQKGADLLAREIDSQTMVCGAFDLAIDAPERIFRIIERTASWRSRITRLPYGDQALFFSRSIFKAVGGFPPFPIMEDVGIMQAVKKQGLRPRILPHAVITSARRWQREGVIYTTLRNWSLILLYGAGVAPDRKSVV